MAPFLVNSNTLAPSHARRSYAAHRIEEIQKLKGHRRIAVLTAYDYPTARIIDEAGFKLLLVGDSLGMVLLGYPDTTHVSMDDMLHHTRAVARSQPATLIGADLPHLSYTDTHTAVCNARRLMDAGADYVKAEGGRDILPQVQAIVGSGIPFMGHLGMLPQHILEEGGKYRIKGRDDAGRQALLTDAHALEDAGAFACVLELVTPPVAAEITRSLTKLLTIGIGSGPDCDGQILVTSDLTGSFPWFTPKFVQPRAQVAALCRDTVEGWRLEIEAYPSQPT